MKYKGNIFQMFMIILAIGILVTFSNTPAMAQDILTGVIGDDGSENLLTDIEGDVKIHWGPADFVTLSINPFAFEGYDATEQSYLRGTGVNRYCSSACYLIAPVNLPTGAVIIGYVLDAYDNSTGSVALVLYYCPVNAMGCTNIGGGIQTSGTPGYTVVYSPLLAHVVNNLGNTYTLEAYLPPGINYRLVGARVAYMLVMSPAPATPTFNDVSPSAWYYQGVEALAASGITTGCGGGNFCPNVAVTRAQMAVFLARALGLHWPY